MTETVTETAAIRMEQNPRWIRGRVGDQTVIDSRDSLFVWEFPYYPQWYFPRGAIQGELRRTDKTITSDNPGTSNNLGTGVVHDLILSANGTVIDGAALIYEDSPVEAIRDRVRFQWDAMDSWLEEDVEVFVHPRSPYTRVDVLPSSRVVTVTVDGETVAESDRPFILYETGLPPRFYLPKSDVKDGVLTPSNSETACPYKGVARYWDVTANGTVHRDLVWGYDDPLPESALVKDLVCFYNEKVDITIDGAPMAKPVTKFS